MTTFHSTRSTTDSLTSKQAIRKGIADDGGLFVTDSLGETHVDVASLAGKSYQQIAFDVLSVLLPDFSEPNSRHASMKRTARNGPTKRSPRSSRSAMTT